MNDVSEVVRIDSSENQWTKESGQLDVRPAVELADPGPRGTFEPTPARSAEFALDVSRALVIEAVESGEAQGVGAAQGMGAAQDVGEAHDIDGRRRPGDQTTHCCDGAESGRPGLSITGVIESVVGERRYLSQ